MKRSIGVSIGRLVRTGAQRTLRSGPAENLKSWLRGTGPANRQGIEVHGDTSAAEVIAYFGDGADNFYQLEQWLPTLETLNSIRPVSLVFRYRAAFAAAKSKTSLGLVLAISYPDLTDLYADSDYKLAIYVNNSMRNFQSMAEPSIIHVHVDHGESDKTSSISNQLKAYDKVFVAGPAAKERCKRTLWGFDASRLASIGRPPLDGTFTSVLPRDSRPTVVYAPTWQGENEANNFTSVDVLGPQIIKSLLSMHVRVVYRPHPRVVGMSESAVSFADHAIRSMIEAANENGEGHIVTTDLNILDIFEDTDVLIADISSVGLDFLYLHTDRGLLLTDRRNDSSRLQETSPAGAVLGTVSLDTIGQLRHMVGESMQATTSQKVRAQLRDLYFGEKRSDGSTAKFMEAVEAAIGDREEQRATGQR